MSSIFCQGFPLFCGQATGERATISIGTLKITGIAIEAFFSVLSPFGFGSLVGAGAGVDGGRVVVCASMLKVVVSESGTIANLRYSRCCPAEPSTHQTQLLLCHGLLQTHSQHILVY